ncbi:hypothetical protein L226DRAFT_474612, partial [Lentinus tigrinus ALCF2SS1-7]|uniref:uncharacterized protein n=1 Tax=Lentinus tigrinus ALCF2SS1-7 TaxID=1328758 RepID=UPI001166241D
GMVFAADPTAKKSPDAFKTNAAAFTSINGSSVAAAGLLGISTVTSLVLSE